MVCNTIKLPKNRTLNWVCIKGHTTCRVIDRDSLECLKSTLIFADPNSKPMIIWWNGLPETSVKHPGARLSTFCIHVSCTYGLGAAHQYSIGPWRKTTLLNNGATPIQQPNCSLTTRWMVQKWSKRCIKSLQRNTMSSKICTTSISLTSITLRSIHDSQNQFLRFLVTMWKCLMYPKYSWSRFLNAPYTNKLDWTTTVNRAKTRYTLCSCYLRKQSSTWPYRFRRML